MIREWLWVYDSIYYRVDNNVGAARNHTGDNTERMGSSHRASVTLDRNLRWAILVCVAQTERAIRMKYQSGRCSFSVEFLIQSLLSFRTGITIAAYVGIFGRIDGY